eukprot:TRINITY_DN21715_c0_g1_i3.p1 TRINITY_DN21715_c0_g1~~TRINITY_DN21715_c0_g1_i3.p1  ORF type:complete len:368 (-),score=48.84 TRINITY_DN21715_c0_g1_i3:604-1707(-)
MPRRYQRCFLVQCHLESEASSLVVLPRWYTRGGQPGCAVMSAPDRASNTDQLMLDAARRILKDSRTQAWAQASAAAAIPDGQWLKMLINEGAKLQQYVGRSADWDEMHSIGASVGVWKDKWQRPTKDFIPDLRAIAVWSIEDVPAASKGIEEGENVEAIRGESLTSLNDFLGTLKNGRSGPAIQISDSIPKSHAIKKYDEESRQKLMSGKWVTEERGLHYANADWHELQLYLSGLRTEGCRLVPRTCEILEKTLPEACSWKRGSIKLSAMAPGTHVVPHTGTSNNRLRLHFGIQVPVGAVLRIADRNYTWQEGRGLIFDDSFEHEVWQSGDKFRLILNVDIPHPDLPKEHKKGAFVKKIADVKGTEL